MEYDKNGGLVDIEDEQVLRMTVPEFKEETTSTTSVVRIHGNRENEPEDDGHNDDEDDKEENDAEDDGQHDDELAERAENSQRNAHYDEEDKERLTPNVRNRSRARPCVQLTFGEVEESLEKFSGDDQADVRRWIEDFEDMTEMYIWTEVQKVAYAKRLLTGSARLFVIYERCAKTWNRLKRALRDEFDDRVDSHRIHARLQERKKKTIETYQEYVYKMLEIATPAMVEKWSVIQFIIEGFADDAVNKSILYGAKTIKQLKERFFQYEGMKREMKNKAKVAERRDDSKGTQKRSAVSTTAAAATKTRRCFNCGDKNHVSADCPVKDKGVKCFKCNKHGHKATVCPTKVKEANLVSRPGDKKYMKDVVIGGQKFTALVDTGSDLTFMRTDEYVKIG
ncbi:unnamed protein product [Brassicogethes aeneus]|uniref:CCHC-type domain-containing protein n=1 Tax=Brassicogethes aeneus TaxID=1431903 RepID=A0A9P0B7X2_BRAAE|nr:unnamed protein product [Brassicogethes aeneus]